MRKKNKNHKYCFGKNCNKDRHVINAVVMVTGLIGPLASIPQAWMIYTTQDASGVSIITWLLFAVYNSSMIVYGAVHKLFPIIFSNIVWVILEAIVVAGIVMYSK